MYIKDNNHIWIEQKISNENMTPVCYHRMTQQIGGHCNVTLYCASDQAKNQQHDLRCDHK